MTSKLCAAGILLKDNKILLGKRSTNRDFYPNVWDIIGGHCENNEIPEQTLSRELKEEIGITPVSFVHISVLKDSKPNIRENYEIYIYLVTDWKGTPKNLLLNEHSKLGWFEIDEALKLHLAHPEYSNLFRSIQKNMGKN